MIGRAGWQTQTPSATPLQSKNEMLIFGLCSSSDDQPGWSMDSNPICHPSPAIKMKCSSLDYIHFWWSAWLVDGLKPHLPPLSSQKHEMLIFVINLISDVGQTCQWTRTPSTTPLQPIKWNASFWIVFTSDDQLGWLMDSKPICQPSPAKKWNVHFRIMFNFWWSARLVDGLKPHPPPLSSQKHEMLIFGLRSTSDNQPGWSMDSNPIHHPSTAQKNEMLIFGLCSTSDYWNG